MEEEDTVRKILVTVKGKRHKDRPALGWEHVVVDDVKIIGREELEECGKKQ